jgi:hypothetical protein
MAKRSSAKVRRAPLALLALALSPNAMAEWKFTPTVDLRAHYSDNVNMQREELAKAQFYTELAPGFSLLNNSPRWKMRTTYSRSFFWAAKDDVPGTRDSAQSLSSAIDARLIDDLLFFDADARIGQQAISAFGPQVNNNSSAAPIAPKCAAGAPAPTCATALAPLPSSSCAICATRSILAVSVWATATATRCRLT